MYFSDAEWNDVEEVDVAVGLTSLLSLHCKRAGINFCFQTFLFSRKIHTLLQAYVINHKIHVCYRTLALSCHAEMNSLIKHFTGTICLPYVKIRHLNA